jgi:hypothetical protein
MNTEPPPPQRHYAWPKYVLASVALFLVVCVTWTIREVNKVKHYRREKNAVRIPASATNTTPAGNLPGR